ncbi:hypothetical protein DEI93_09510 [Curtobacterium sp. MCBD17_035]|uniref:hypothetical protein n=1 Tax=Curtobacterium sp. MCBD17_035 TaxID=2175673 RepID=UPI0011B43654|nr:hypothetical protein [Curtobacterium sp. MCBD17_035]WIB66231.1 hypothetical protein DEI93_09510 [Curtobacterium sp. MCBD17_035]
MGEKWGMPSAESRRARLLKFITRADWVLQGPLFEVRPMSEFGWKLQLRIERDPATGAERATGLGLGVPDFDDDVLGGNASRCRVLFIEEEDNYLPSVVNVLRQSVGEERRKELALLKKFVGARVRDGKLVGAHMYSGRLEGENGENAGQLHGNDQIAMDYLYGRLLHEDKDAAARLTDTTTDMTVKHAVVSKLHDLMQATYWTRAEALRAAADNELDFDLPEEVRSGRDLRGGPLRGGGA